MKGIKPLITVFTATYNRAHLLPRLFTSLTEQTASNFEWIIVDDGSTDMTPQVVQKFKDSTTFPILYYLQENQGKHIAINKGVSSANGAFFFIVDSDDRLPHNSIEIINAKLNQIFGDDKIAGVVGLKCFFNQKVVGSTHIREDIICDIFDYRYDYKVIGDRAEVFKTAILKKIPFPKFGQEKFVPESIVWNRIGQEYNMLFFNENIYECEYLADGLSAHSIALRRQNPKGILSLYSELGRIKKIGIHNRIKVYTNFWRFYFCDKENKRRNIKLVKFELLVLMTLPLGLFFYLRDTSKISKHV